MDSRIGSVRVLPCKVKVRIRLAEEILHIKVVPGDVVYISIHYLVREESANSKPSCPDLSQRTAVLAVDYCQISPQQ